MEEYKLINRNLIKFYGKSPEGLPAYRIAFSTGLVEKRYGKFATYYGSIFIREEMGVTEVLKYPYKEDKDKWILERLIPTIGNDELNRISKYSYEPLWIFRTTYGEYQKPIWKAVEFLIRMLTSPKLKESPQSLEDRDEREFQEEIARNVEMMDSSYIASMLGNREAVTVPSSYSKE